MSQVPPISTDPIELLTNRYLIEEPYINKFWGPAIVGGFAFIGVCVSHWYMRRPVFSGIQRHIGLTAAGIVLGKYIDDYRSGYFAERDAALRHYIELHRDEFPDLQRKKYSEVFEEWLPIR